MDIENIIDKLKKKDGFCSLKGAAEEEIREAEQTLDLTFAREYVDYLQAFGLASFRGHELTGIIKSPRLNVVKQTVLGKEANPQVSDDFYVIETANIDGIVIWQKSSGEIFKTVFDSSPVLICESLGDYIERYAV